MKGKVMQDVVTLKRIPAAKFVTRLIEAGWGVAPHSIGEQRLH